jgi:Coenzyme PQQ synthesis protein D (PqqD)
MAGRELFSAVPVPASGASLSQRPDGGGVLSLQGEAPSGFWGSLVRRLGLERRVRFELDALGVCYWTHVDGERSLLEIQRALCDQFSLPGAQARRAIVEFTAALMRRNLVALRLEQP